MPLGIATVFQQEIEALWQQTLPEYPWYPSPKEWTKVLLLPEYWEVIGVSMLPLVDRVLFLIKSEYIEPSLNGLTDISLRYVDQPGSGLTLLTIIQYPSRVPCFQKEAMMSDPVTRNISSDDAAIFAANTPDTETDDMDEDPVSRGASKAGKVDMFKGYQPRTPKAVTRGGNREPGTGGISLTPGARKHPEIGPGKLEI
jgi:hypothetical protein